MLESFKLLDTVPCLDFKGTNPFVEKDKLWHLEVGVLLQDALLFPAAAPD